MPLGVGHYQPAVNSLSFMRRGGFMLSFIICLAILVCGYFTYGKLVDSTFGPDDRETPAVAINDGVDYVVMPQWKLFLVQLLNIAGLGPIFVILLIMVGTVFAVGPAGLLVKLLSEKGVTGPLAQTTVWLAIILIYYFIATFISIDKIIGKIYPVFGICLIVMAVGVSIGLPMHGYKIPEIWNNFRSMHPAGTPVWSFMFITVACGAISGFHATQSPLMARCLKSERQGHFVFYGAMVAEGCIALVWAAAGCSLYEVTGGLNTGLQTVLADGQSAAIYDVCAKTMGSIGVILAMLGVIACPITSGDTAFRSARLTLSDWFQIDQESYANRLKLCIPVLGVGAVLGFGNTLGFIDYSVIWRYFSWTNQTLAMIVLEELLGLRCACNIHERCIHHLLRDGEGMPRNDSGTDAEYEGGLSGRTCCGGMLPGTFPYKSEKVCEVRRAMILWLRLQ